MLWRTTALGSFSRSLEPVCWHQLMAFCKVLGPSGSSKRFGRVLHYTAGELGHLPRQRSSAIIVVDATRVHPGLCRGQCGARDTRSTVPGHRSEQVAWRCTGPAALVHGCRTATLRPSRPSTPGITLRCIDSVQAIGRAVQRDGVAVCDDHFVCPARLGRPPHAEVGHLLLVAGGASYELPQRSRAEPSLLGLDPQRA
jgi:hypothetical protein